MEKRWHKIWHPNAPKSFTPEKLIDECLRDNAIKYPEKIALSFYGRNIKYKELDNTIEQLASGLINLGVKVGDRVAIYMENCPQFVIGYFGILRAGAIVVPVNPMFKYLELEYELNDSGAETLIAFDYLFPEIEKAKSQTKLNNIILTSLWDYLPENPTLPLPPETKYPKETIPGTIDFMKLLEEAPLWTGSKVGNFKEDIAILQYTAGTTGLPKGAMITHSAAAFHIIGTTLTFGYTQEDVHIGVMPFFHVQGMVQSMGAALVTGCRLVILARFTPEVLIRAIAEYKCTVLITTTTMVIAMINWPGIDQYNLSSLRIVWYGGAPMPIEISDRLKQKVPNAAMGEGYGLTETFGVGAITPRNRSKPGFIGIPFISTDIEIVDLETGLKGIGSEREGEIIIKTPSAMKGYWNKPEETREALREGWIYTGDIGKMDEEGYLSIVGRKKELIKCSGFNVSPVEIEEILYRNSSISEVAVIGIPDPYRGEVPKVFVVLKPEYKGKINEEDIINWAKENISSHKRPRIVDFRDSLPKSSAGKILRRILIEEEKKKGGERAT